MVMVLMTFYYERIYALIDDLSNMNTSNNKILNNYYK